MVLGQLELHMQKNEVGFLPKLYININLKWISNLNIGAKIIKLLVENKGKLFLTSDLAIVVCMTPKAQTKTEKN